MGGTQIFDDGTELVTDASGAVVSYTDLSGARYSPDTSVLNGFLTSVLGGLSNAINTRINPVPVAPAAAPASNALAQLMPVALLALGAFALYKAAT